MLLEAVGGSADAWPCILLLLQMQCWLRARCSWFEGFGVATNWLLGRSLIWNTQLNLSAVDVYIQPEVDVELFLRAVAAARLNRGRCARNNPYLHWLTNSLHVKLCRNCSRENIQWYQSRRPIS